MTNRPKNGKITTAGDKRDGPSQDELEAIRNLYAEADAIITSENAAPQETSVDDIREAEGSPEAGEATAIEGEESALSAVVTHQPTCKSGTGDPA